MLNEPGWIRNNAEAQVSFPHNLVLEIFFNFIVFPAPWVLSVK